MLQISLQNIDTFNLDTINITMTGYINGVNISNLSSSYLSLSGNNANQNISISPYSFRSRLVQWEI